MKNLEVTQLTDLDVRETIDEEKEGKFPADAPFNPLIFAHTQTQAFIDLDTVKSEYFHHTSKRYQVEIVCSVGVLITTATLFALNLGNPIFGGLFVLSIVLLLAYVFFVGRIRRWRKAQLTALVDIARSYSPLVLSRSWNEWVEARYGIDTEDFPPFRMTGEGFTVNETDYTYISLRDDAWLLGDAEGKELPLAEETVNK